MDSETMQQRYAPEPQQMGDSHSLDIPSGEDMAAVYFNEVVPLAQDSAAEFSD